MSGLNPVNGTNGHPSDASAWALRIGFYSFILLTTSIMLAAWTVKEARDLIPDSGLGYALGISGSVLMLVLLVYPLRKRLRVLQSWWSIAAWFRLHMLLGVLGPCLILLHCNFSLGSTNSAVALIAMLLVAGSGLVGRYFYGKFHYGLYGEKLKLGQLRAELDQLFADLPAQGATAQHKRIEDLHKGCIQIIASQQQGLSFTQLMQQRRWLRSRKTVVRRLGSEIPDLSLRWNALSRLMDSLAGLALFERLFSIWHVVHIPIFVVMVLTVLVHIFVVHWY